MLLLIAVAYKRAFSISVETRDLRNELNDTVEKAKNADQEIKAAYAQIAGLNRYLGKENVTIEKVQQGFLNFFAQHAKGIVVYQIDEVLNFKHPDFEINTHRIVLKGGYLNTLKFLYEMEKDFPLAKMLNVSFEFKKYAADEDPDLYTTILIQNYLR
jgi:hypothetical protein